MSDTESDSTDTGSEASSSNSDQNIGNLVHLARLLTGDPVFLTQDATSLDTLLDLNNAPDCDVTHEQLQENPYFKLIGELTSNPPSYEGDDPIADITLVFRQLASCQKSTGSLLSKIGDFFTRKDGGKALKGLLMMSEVVIKCLALWYVMKTNGLLTQGSQDEENLQDFCKSAIDKHGIANADQDLIPPSIAKLLPRAESWDQNLATIQSTFSIGNTSAAPILLIFNEEALDHIMDITQKGQQLPPQVARDDTSSEDESSDEEGDGGKNESFPMVFVPRARLTAVAKDYLRSGPVKEAATMQPMLS